MTRIADPSATSEMSEFENRWNCVHGRTCECFCMSYVSLFPVIYFVFWNDHFNCTIHCLKVQRNDPWCIMKPLFWNLSSNKNSLLDSTTSRKIGLHTWLLTMELRNRNSFFKSERKICTPGTYSEAAILNHVQSRQMKYAVCRSSWQMHFNNRLLLKCVNPVQWSGFGQSFHRDLFTNVSKERNRRKIYSSNKFNFVFY